MKVHGTWHRSVRNVHKERIVDIIWVTYSTRPYSLSSVLCGLPHVMLWGLSTLTCCSEACHTCCSEVYIYTSRCFSEVFVTLRSASVSRVERMLTLCAVLLPFAGRRKKQTGPDEHSSVVLRGGDANPCRETPPPRGNLGHAEGPARRGSGGPPPNRQFYQQGHHGGGF